jgi:hypothetical protein
MIGACIGIAIFAAVLTAGYLEGRLDEYASLGWIVALLVIVAVAGYLGQRDGGA